MAGADKPYDKNVRITMRKILLLTPFLFAAVAFAFEDPIELWANAVGGREKVAAIKSIYREATLEFGNYQGTIKVWHTADGKYRKEEQIEPPRESRRQISLSQAAAADSSSW